MWDVATIAGPVTNYSERALKALNTLPPFSPVLNRLLAMMADDGVAFSRVSDLIEKDTVIAGNILKLVNSALYGRRGTINSVRHAVALLGVGKLRNAVLGMSVTRMWGQVRTAPGWSTARFNLHSVATAILADLLAQRLPIAYAEGAFVAGLFHDLGKLLIAVALREEYQVIQTRYGEGKRSWVECELEVLGTTHGAISADALATWNLPEPIRTAVRFHHNPAEDPTDARLGTYKLSQAVWCANHHVNNINIRVAKDQSPAEPTLANPFATLGFDTAEPAFLDEFQNEFTALSAFFR